MATYVYRTYKKKGRKGKKVKKTVYKGGRRVYSNRSKSTTRGYAEGPFPPTLRRKLLYSDVYAITSTGGNLGSQKFKLNSLYDPDSTGVGHQPRYLDQLLSTVASTAPYSRYRVWGIKVTVTARNISDYGGVIYLQPANTSSSEDPSEIYDIIENRTNRFKHLTPKGGSRDQVTLVSYIYMPRAFGVSKQQYGSDSTYAGLYNGDPSGLMYGTLGLMTDVAQDMTVEATVQLDFYCEFFDHNYCSHS